jgi:hypothetical protein
MTSLLSGDPPQSRPLEQTEQFKDDHYNDNYSDYVEDASVHGGDSVASSFKFFKTSAIDAGRSDPGRTQFRPL